MLDNFNDECGVFPIFNHEYAARLTYLGFYAFAHRRQESAGMVSSDGERLQAHRWGNRTAVWDAVSGGNQIQAVSLEQSGGAPTNRISVLSLPGWYGTYSYDAAGNVMWDGVHSYQYDARNRQVAVDSGSTASYTHHHLRLFQMTEDKVYAAS